MLKDFLDAKAEEYNRPDFIANDPIAVPRSFTRKEDIEISGLFAALLAWGQRKTIINKCRELMRRMDDNPHDFIKNAGNRDLKNLSGFKHRTFNETDLLYFVAFLQRVYKKYRSLEEIFTGGGGAWTGENTEAALRRFYDAFVNHPDFPQRTRKHVHSPDRKSACKRINMYLRWMVRKDNRGVDFGLWEKLKPSQLICPCDVHVHRVARKLGLISRKRADWHTALELTENLKKMNSQDPVWYDFALFGLGIEEKF